MGKGNTSKAVVKCTKCNKPFSVDAALSEEERPKLCSACIAYRNKKIYRQCKQCGQTFYIKQEEADFLRSKGLELYSHCFQCRQVRKSERTEDVKE